MLNGLSTYLQCSDRLEECEVFIFDELASVECYDWINQLMREMCRRVCRPDAALVKIFVISLDAILLLCSLVLLVES